MISNFFHKTPKSAPRIKPENGRDFNDEFHSGILPDKNTDMTSFKKQEIDLVFSNNNFEETTMSIISKGAILEGNITVEGQIKIEGHLKGNVICSSSVIIGESGTLEGNVKAANMQVAGKFKGQAELDGECLVSSTGNIIGDLVIASFNFNTGGTMTGTVTMKNSAISEDSEIPANVLYATFENTDRTRSLQANNRHTSQNTH